MIYSNGPAVELAFANAGELAARLADTVPLIRPVPLPEGVTGRWFTADLNAYGLPVAQGEPRVTLFANDAGHWSLSTDPGMEPICRGCRQVGDDLDGRCPKPPSQQDIATALFESVQRPAPARMRSHRVRFIRSAVAA